MIIFNLRKIFGLAALMALALTLSACGETMTRLSEVGSGPKLSRITNPTAQPNYRPVSLPMPAAETAVVNPNSLWRSGARAFFKDRRAKEVGDILTVIVDFSDKATLNNKTTRKRADSEKTGVPNLLGLEGEYSKVLPQGVDPSSMLSFGNAMDTQGDGTVARSEVVKLSLAAVVTQILPNGNLVILGRQEMLVNSELREMMVTGVVRPGDIESDNTVQQTSIAEMRIAYGGRGTISELQKPRWGTQIWDILFPF